MLEKAFGIERMFDKERARFDALLDAEGNGVEDMYCEGVKHAVELKAIDGGSRAPRRDRHSRNPEHLSRSWQKSL